MTTVLLMAVLAAAPAPERWSNPAEQPLPVGVVHRTFESRSMKTSVGYTIYLPPGYDAEPGRRYPVVYFLHGRGGHELMNPRSYEILDAAIRAGEVPPLIYVHAMGGRNSGYADAPDGSVMGETVIVEELIPHVDRMYRTIASPDGRGLEGFSMGGQGALRLAFKRPALFGSVVAYGSGLATGAELRRELPRVFAKMHADDVAQFDRTSVWTYARRNAARIRRSLAIRICIGTRDQHLERNRRMHALLDDLRVPHQYQELPELGHSPPRTYDLVGREGFRFHTASRSKRP